MNIKLKTIVLALCLTGMTASISAQKTPGENRPNQSLEMRLSMLQKKVDALQLKLASNGNDQSQTTRIVNTTTTAHPENIAPNFTPPTIPRSSPAPQAQSPRLPLTRRDLARTISQDTDYLPFDIDVPGQAFVSTGPYIGVPISYAGTDLIINSPSVNTDLQLLNIRKNIQNQLKAMLGDLPVKNTHGHVLLSGIIETQAGYFWRGGRSDTSDIDVTNVSLDTFVLGPSNWLLGFVELSYDNGIFNPFRIRSTDCDINSTIVQVPSLYRVGHSRVYVNKAFVTIGDLTQAPYYGTFGQFYVPFGRYSSIMISDPLTKILARTKARAIQIGFQQPNNPGFYGAAYVFRGESHAAAVSRINNGGVNLGFKLKSECFGFDVGGGLISNIADSAGMQLGNGFQFFEDIHHRVPAYNLRGIFNIGKKIDIISEFVGTTTDYNVNDMSYKNTGAKPWAFDVEIGYSFPILNDKPSTLGAGWTQSHQALTLGIPLKRYYIVFNTSLFRSTLQQIEFRHDVNYASSVQANGPTNNDQTCPGECTAIVCSASGRSDNAIQVNFDYYF